MATRQQNHSAMAAGMGFSRENFDEGASRAPQHGTAAQQGHKGTAGLPKPPTVAEPDVASFYVLCFSSDRADGGAGEIIGHKLVENSRSTPCPSSPARLTQPLEKPFFF